MNMDIELKEAFDAIIPLYDPERQSRNAVIRTAMRMLIEDAKRRDRRDAVPRGEITGPA